MVFYETEMYGSLIFTNHLKYIQIIHCGKSNPKEVHSCTIDSCNESDTEKRNFGFGKTKRDLGGIVGNN